MLQLRNWNKGDDVFEAAHHQEPVDALRALAGVRPYGQGGLLPIERGLAIVTDQGPKGESIAKVDERYWIKPAFPTDKAPDGTAVSAYSLVDLAPEATDALKHRVVMAVNVAEMGRNKKEAGLSAPEAGTHRLPKGTVVEYWATADAGDPPNVRYYFNRRPTAPQVMTIAKDGGSDGGQAVAATWTYSIKDDSGTVITGATGISPDWGRPSGSVSPATKGLCYQDSTGAWKIAVAFEVPASGTSCT